MTSRKLLAIFTSGCLTVGCGSHLLSQGLPPAPPMLPATPTENVVYTSTRMVNSLDVASDGVLWAATNGGVLMCSSEGQWRKWTRHDGLPSNEVQSVRCTDRFITVSTPLGQAMLNKSELHSDKWRKADRAIVTTNPVQWRGETISATLEGIRVARGSKRRHIALPVSGGTHATALLPRGKHLWVALFGDDLWQYDGKTWQRLDIGLPAAAREITTMREDATRSVLWLGTRNDGIWRCDLPSRRWTQHLQTDEPPGHNVQALTAFRGNLFASTLEDGSITRSASNWKHFIPPQTSSLAPRQMMPFRGTLYVRHGSGQVDGNNGSEWSRDVFRTLPRRKVYALAADDAHIFAAQWGGWSQWDGAQWAHHFDVPELQGVPVMALLPDGDKLWVATQSRGLGEYSYARKTLRWHDERHGLPDEWITCLMKVDGELYAGTFVGGLARFDGAKWHVFPELRGQNVTALEVNERGALYIATRYGLWRRRGDGTLARLPHDVADSEVQALCAVHGGMWIGTRTGLYFLMT